MKAYWLGTGSNITVEELKSQGIDYEQISLSNYQKILDRKKKESCCVHQDEVNLTLETPNLDAILTKFDKEHDHSLDEVRYVVEGEGIFDIRPLDNSQYDWMRVHVEQEDYLSVPAGRYHRFLLSEERRIRTIRLFQDNSGWVPQYRE